MFSSGLWKTSGRISTKLGWGCVTFGEDPDKGTSAGYFFTSISLKLPGSSQLFDISDSQRIMHGLCEHNFMKVQIKSESSGFNHIVFDI